MVQRYDLAPVNLNNIRITENDNGDYVLYRDYLNMLPDVVTLHRQVLQSRIKHDLEALLNYIDLQAGYKIKLDHSEAYIVVGDEATIKRLMGINESPAALVQTSVNAKAEG